MSDVLFRKKPGGIYIMAIKGLKSYYKENWTSFHALSEEQVEEVILGAFEILETIGIKSNDRIRDLFKAE